MRYLLLGMLFLAPSVWAKNVIVFSPYEFIGVEAYHEEVAGTDQFAYRKAVWIGQSRSSIDRFGITAQIPLAGQVLIGGKVGVVRQSYDAEETRDLAGHSYTGNGNYF